MARKLKTFQTSQGFFDLAVAAPSMKAALEAWGSHQNLFQQGVARESDDAAVIAATLAQPGVVLKRPVGSNGAFSDHAELPSSLPIGKAKRAKPKPAKAKPKATKPKTAKPKPAKQTASPARQAADRKAALAYEKRQQQQARAQRQQEAAASKARARQARALDKAKAALDAAKAQHQAALDAIAAEHDRLDRQSEQEEARWAKQRKTLDTALRRLR